MRRPCVSCPGATTPPPGHSLPNPATGACTTPSRGSTRKSGEPIRATGRSPDSTSGPRARWHRTSTRSCRSTTAAADGGPRGGGAPPSEAVAEVVDVPFEAPCDQYAGAVRVEFAVACGHGVGIDAQAARLEPEPSLRALNGGGASCGQPCATRGGSLPTRRRGHGCGAAPARAVPARRSRCRAALRRPRRRQYAASMRTSRSPSALRRNNVRSPSSA